MKLPRSLFAYLLSGGALKEIAEKLGVGASAASSPIRYGRPPHPAVIEGRRWGELSDAKGTAQQLAALTG